MRRTLSACRRRARRMTTPPTTTEPLTFLRRRADVSTATRSPCSGGRSATASCSAAIPTHRPRSPRDAAADTRRRFAGEYRRNQQRDRLPSESDPSVTIIGPGTGPPLAGQGVLSDLIAVERSRTSEGRAAKREHVEQLSRIADAVASTALPVAAWMPSSSRHCGRPQRTTTRRPALRRRGPANRAAECGRRPTTPRCPRPTSRAVRR